LQVAVRTQFRRSQAGDHVRVVDVEQLLWSDFNPRQANALARPPVAAFGVVESAVLRELAEVQLADRKPAEGPQAAADGTAWKVRAVPDSDVAQRRGDHGDITGDEALLQTHDVGLKLGQCGSDRGDPLCAVLGEPIHVLDVERHHAQLARFRPRRRRREEILAAGVVGRTRKAQQAAALQGQQQAGP
jgi:hypothetical protein